VVTKSQPILAHGQQILRRTMLERFGAGEASRPGADCFHPRNFPMRGRTRDSDSRQRAAPFRCETGEIVGGVSILQNVDRKKRAEQRPPKAKRLQAAVDQALLEQGSWASNYHNFLASLTG
jgi:hypothetical protein